jgi:hypothetical protein
MPDWSRRRALQATASAAALALAGCSGETSRSGSSGPANGELVTDYEVQKVRSADGAVLFREADVETASEAADERTAERRRRVQQYEHVTDRRDLEDLAFATDVSEAATLEEFTTATDLESESVFLLQRGVSACSTLELVGVRREPDSVHVDTCSDLRPADVECEADDRDVVAFAIRLPFPGDEFNGMGAGWSSSCHSRPRAFDPGAYNGTETGDESGGGSP